MTDKNQNPIERTIKGAGDTADTTVDTAAKVGSNVITESGKVIKSTEHAVGGVAEEGLDDIDDVASKAGGMAKKAAENTAALPHDLYKSATTGKPEK